MRLSAAYTNSESADENELKEPKDKIQNVTFLYLFFDN